MKLYIQPEDGNAHLLKAIDGARKTIEIMIFRFDEKKIEAALVSAVKRGVLVNALIAFTNRGGEKRLRGLEMRLLAAGATVSRTNDDLTRYHGKYMIVDRKKLFVLAFNFTRSDIEQSRSFGVMTTNTKLVQEAAKLFLADSNRQPYTAGTHGFVVSPVNARERLAELLKSAKKSLLIYDLEVSDKMMLDILKEKVAAGVPVRVIGNVKPNTPAISVRFSNPLRLHVRGIVCDGSRVFLGSQSLRHFELDMRREVGLIAKDATLAARVTKVFEQDWESGKSSGVPVEKVAGKVAKAITKSMAAVGPVLDQLQAKSGKKLDIDRKELQQTVNEAVKTAVRDAVHEAVTEGAASKD
ncbi:MAG: phospholipase D-like domain-containing protein [Acidobacteriota bacterium]